MEEWKPRVAEGPAPLYERLADAIERDIRGGDLAPGAQLPPHRELAQALAVGVGTVTKAYGEVQRRGLIAGTVGRGSFVSPRIEPASMPGATDGLIDLARNLPPACSVVRHLADATAVLRRRPDFGVAATYTAPEGLPALRRVAAEWLRRRHGLRDVAADTLVQTNGAQHGMALVFGAVCRPGDTILCEAATFHGIKALAEVGGFRLRGVAMDEQGLVPAALDEAAQATGSPALYTIPTLQNPTTVTMSARRKAEIIEVARRRGLLIVEDEAYRAIADPERRTTPFADLAPDITAYLATISKELFPGLRLGFIRPPDAGLRDRLIKGVRATGYAPPSLSGLIFRQWFEDGTADLVADEVMAEARRRTDLARAAFGTAMLEPHSRQSLNVWLPLSPLEAERAAGRALRAGVEVTPPDAPVVAGADISGLRICLGPTPDLPTLDRALGIVARALHGEIDDRAIA